MGSWSQLKELEIPAGLLFIIEIMEVFASCLTLIAQSGLFPDSKSRQLSSSDVDKVPVWVEFSKINLTFLSLLLFLENVEIEIIGVFSYYPAFSTNIWFAI